MWSAVFAGIPSSFPGLTLSFPQPVRGVGVGKGNLLGVAAYWHGVGEIWPKGSKFPDPFNVFFLGFCGPGVCFASSPCSGIFTKASCLCAVLVTLSMRGD